MVKTTEEITQGKSLSCDYARARTRARTRTHTHTHTHTNRHKTHHSREAEKHTEALDKLLYSP